MPAPPRRHVSAGPTARASAEVWALTVLAHSIAGGGLPSLLWLVGVAGLVATSTAWVLRRSVRPVVMLPALVLCQLALHAMFAGLTAAGHAHHAASQAPWWVQELSPRMLLAHVLCAVLTGVVWWVRRSVVHVVLSLADVAAVETRRPGGLAAPRVTHGPAKVWLFGGPGRAPPRLLAQV